MLIKKMMFSLKVLFFIIISCFIESHDAVTINSESIEIEFIENSSMEEVNPDNSNKPDKWSNNSWGDNTAKFTFLNEGYFGNHSVKAEIEEYVSGDAKWFFDPIELIPRDYVFSNYYRSNVDTRLVLAITTKKGNTEYSDLPIASASEDWTKYETSFSMPEYGETVTIYHLLSQDGYLITDSYQIKPYNHTGFNQGLLTITFDDGWETNTHTALPILIDLGFKSNQFYATTYIQNSRVPNPKELIQLFIDAGHEIGSHSVTHPYLTTLSKKDLTYELIESKSFLENFLDVDINYFATPFGDYNAPVKDEIMKYYSIHRTAIDFGFNSKDNLDFSRLKSQSVLSTTTKEEIEQWVKKAKEEKLWLILLYHEITDNPNEYDTTEDMFIDHMQVIKDSEISVVTVSEAIAEISSQ